MLINNALQRVFIKKEGNEETPLTDPDHNWPPKRVLTFYAVTFPVLTTALIQGPDVRDDKIYFLFVSIIGTKG